MVEIMVSLVLVAVAAGFVFAIQSRTSQVLRDQSSIAEVQQTLRVATEQILRDLRLAGYLAKSINMPVPNGGNPTKQGGKCIADGAAILNTGPVSVVNSSTGPDLLRLQYGNTAIQARISEKGPSFHASTTDVDDSSGFETGDLAIAVHTREPLLGHGCAIQVTKVSANPSSGKDRIGHNHGQASDINKPSNCQCDDIEAVWDDGYTVFTKVALRGYRIKPADPRGILQMTSSNLLGDNWVDLAVGIVDMQIALRVYQPDDLINDYDGDGDPQRDWFSGEEMETVLGTDPDNELLQISVTLLAKTEVHGVEIDSTPDLVEPGKIEGFLTFNRVGDRIGTSLPVSDVTSPYFGENVYRSFTATIDFRNLGVGK
jgi:hypothetical protein